MSELQIKISLGELEVFLQGDGDLVYKVFTDIRDKGIGELGDTKQPKIANKLLTEEVTDKKIETSAPVTLPVTKTRKKTVQATGQLLKDLDLSGKNGVSQSLKDFVNEKKPGSNVQKTAVFVYYLQNILKVEEISIDHIFTCYKTLGYRMPNNLQQNLADTCSSRYGYTSRKDGKYSMTVVGNNYVEFDMNKGE